MQEVGAERLAARAAQAAHAEQPGHAAGPERADEADLEQHERVDARASPTVGAPSADDAGDEVGPPRRRPRAPARRRGSGRRSPPWSRCARRAPRAAPRSARRRPASSRRWRGCPPGASSSRWRAATCAIVAERAVARQEARDEQHGPAVAGRARRRRARPGCAGAAAASKPEAGLAPERRHVRRAVPFTRITPSETGRSQPPNRGGFAGGTGVASRPMRAATIRDGQIAVEEHPDPDPAGRRAARPRARRRPQRRRHARSSRAAIPRRPARRRTSPGSSWPARWSRPATASSASSRATA